LGGVFAGSRAGKLNVMSQTNDELDEMTSRLLEAGEVMRRLESRLGQLHAKLRLGIEREHDEQAFGQGLTFLHIENMPLAQAVIEVVLRATGTYWSGRANASKVALKRNDVRIANLPGAFDGFTILHLSDLHADMSAPALQRVNEMVRDIDYDLCALTGDYRGRTFGDCKPCLGALARLREALRGDIYAVLGNHDSIAMVPDLEDMGIRVLLNECAIINRGSAMLCLAGVDDAHFYRADNIEKAAANIPHDSVSILLSHTPEIYRQAAHAGFDLMLSGHTHGGQICLPGGVPILLEAKVPRALGAGAWRHSGMAGYTSVGAGSSVVPVRFNNRPEITLHRLVRDTGQ
jgi:predicted MPP superfamily phosphohydrolase